MVDCCGGSEPIEISYYTTADDGERRASRKARQWWMMMMVVNTKASEPQGEGAVDCNVTTITVGNNVDYYAVGGGGRNGMKFKSFSFC